MAHNALRSRDSTGHVLMIRVRVRVRVRVRDFTGHVLTTDLLEGISSDLRVRVRVGVSVSVS